MVHVHAQQNVLCKWRQINPHRLMLSSRKINLSRMVLRMVLNTEKRFFKAVKIHPISTSGIETSILRDTAYMASQQERSLRWPQESLHSSHLLDLYKNWRTALVNHCRATSYFSKSSSEARMGYFQEIPSE